MNFVQESNKKMAKSTLARLEKTMQIEVEIKPLITDVMKSQGWWRVSATLPFPSKHWRLTRDHETSALATKALSVLWAALLQRCSQPQLLPVRALAVGTKCLWSRQPTRWPPTMALVPSTPSFPTPPTQGCDSPHFLTSLILQPFKLLKLAVQKQPTVPRLPYPFPFVSAFLFLLSYSSLQMTVLK